MLIHSLIGRHSCCLQVSATIVVLVSVFWRDEYSLEYMPGNSLVLYTCLSQALENVVTLFPKVVLLLSAPLGNLGEFKCLHVLTLSIAGSFMFSHLGRGIVYHFEFS